MSAPPMAPTPEARHRQALAWKSLAGGPARTDSATGLVMKHSVHPVMMPGGGLEVDCPCFLRQDESSPIEASAVSTIALPPLTLRPQGKQNLFGSASAIGRRPRATLGKSVTSNILAGP